MRYEADDGEMSMSMDMGGSGWMGIEYGGDGGDGGDGDGYGDDDGYDDGYGDGY